MTGGHRDIDQMKERVRERETGGKAEKRKESNGKTLIEMESGKRRENRSERAVEKAYLSQWRGQNVSVFIEKHGLTLASSFVYRPVRR